MMFSWWKKGQKDVTEQLEWEYSEKPVYDAAEHEETMRIIAEIHEKLDEIKVIINEMRQEKNG